MMVQKSDKHNIAQNAHALLLLIVVGKTQTSFFCKIFSYWSNKGKCELGCENFCLSENETDLCFWIAELGH